MTSPQLSRIPIDKRRRLAATVGLFAMLFIAVGAVASTGPDTATIKVFVVLAFLIAVTLGLVAWGVLTSVKNDLAEQRLDAVIQETIAAKGMRTCDCGHDHDPTELHVVGEPAPSLPAGAACAHDGSGDVCAHDCTTCVMTALRGQPAAAVTTAAAAGSVRPSPSPLPSRSPRPRPRPQPAPR